MTEAANGTLTPAEQAHLHANVERLGMIRAAIEDTLNAHSGLCLDDRGERALLCADLLIAIINAAEATA